MFVVSHDTQGKLNR